MNMFDWINWAFLMLDERFKPFIPYIWDIEFYDIGLEKTLIEVKQ